ncbi:MAG: hypothetical protein D6734_10685 [Candidatus Schekmanbacteria bacterium]|nr:MAG: hypothetical protein D6734_10685 [Candidatus Schekmanbacteria bacterium]
MMKIDEKNFTIILSLFFVFLISMNSSAEIKCTQCHSEKSILKSKRGDKLYIDLSRYTTSVHGDLLCRDCHSEIGEVRSSLDHGENAKEVRCEDCHEEEYEIYRKSVHGWSKKSHKYSPPYCSDCHGTHYISCVSDPDCQVSPINQIKVCIKCHEDENVVNDYGLPSIRFIQSYEKSVHGKAIEEKGLLVAAVCSDCHGGHGIREIKDINDVVFKKDIVTICGRCHKPIMENYKAGIHWTALNNGIVESPSCINCHGEHEILPPTDKKSSVFTANIPSTCSKCHENETISSAYGIPSGRFKTYMDSFHGLLLEYGELKSANCASCHGAHKILPSTNPESRVYKDNLPHTCGKCHPNAGEKFKNVKIHITADKDVSPGKYYIRKFYVWFIGILVTFFLIYVAMELYSYFSKKKS